MTRAQFLNDLYHHLYGMTKEQAEQHLTYYAEMLADRMEEGMTEEEAVAGMEDVETIARRIMEEEGLPYTSPEEGPPAPPEYPDASKLQGGGGTRAYQSPKRSGRRRIVLIVLWAVAAAVVLGTLSRWLWTRKHTDIPIRSDTVTESAAPEAPYAEWYEEYDPEAPYIEGYEYGGGEYMANAGSIQSIDIQWASGTVYVQSWSGDEIRVQEYTHSELSERTAMSCLDDGETLTIRYRDGLSLGGVKDEKWLTVLIPDGMVRELKIETTSAGVRLNDLESEKLTVSTASGHIEPAGCYAQAAELFSISGEIGLSGLYADTLDISTTSSEIYGAVQGGSMDISTVSGEVMLYSIGSAERISVETISGDIELCVEDPSVQFIGITSTSGDTSLGLPYDTGFTLDYGTVSGDLLPNTDYDLIQQNGAYIYNGGGCRVEVVTVSGDLEIY